MASPNREQRTTGPERTRGAASHAAPQPAHGLTSGPEAAEIAGEATRLLALQRSHAERNRSVVLAKGSGPAGEPGAAGVSIPTGGGQPLEPGVRGDMEQRFGTSFSAVRVHDGADAAAAAHDLGARAFTSGQDVYFGHGAYQPRNEPGRALLAHELTHTLQQRGQPAAPQRAALVISADDPLEREADRVADAVLAGAPPGAISNVGDSIAPLARLVQRQPAGTPAKSAAAPPGAGAGPTAEGDFVVGLGPIKIKREELAGVARKGRYERDLSAMSLPGLKLKTLTLDLDRASGEVKGGRVLAEVNVPFVKALERGAARFDIAKDGSASFKARAQLQVPALNSPQIEVSLQEGAIAAEATLAPDKLRVPGLPKLKIPSGSVTVGIANGRLAGSGNVALEYAGLAKGEFGVVFKDGVPAGKGRVELTPGYLRGVQVALEVAEGKLQGEVSLPAAKLAPPVPGLKISEGTLTLGMSNGRLTGAGEGILFSYQGLGSGSLSFLVKGDQLSGSGALALTIPGLAPVKGELGYRGGNLSGRATITADKFPKGLPVKGGSISVSVDGEGAIAGKGSVRVQLLGVGEGEIRLGYDKGILDLGADVELKKIPGLEQGRVHIGVKDGVLEGEGEIAIAPKQIPGLTGNLLVVYKESRFSGKAKLGYAKDKFSGELQLVLDQDEKGKMAVSGSGEVTARLTDWLTGKVHIDVLPDASTRIAGQLKADDVQLFAERKADRELFSYSQNIPLWAILVAVIRMRAGVRAGVGPGMLRGVTAEGEFSTVAGEQPSFSITGELFIPAYAEAYVAFGAGLGLDVVIGSLTGGIEAVGTAGIYGAVSVIPEIEYRDGNFAISGTATLAAGAKLKLGLQAWAEVEAFWITVWEQTWQLAEWVWDVGPELALQAQMNYVFGRPEPPTFEFKTSDIDAKRLIQDAMPKDGPKGSGAREGLQNRAQWKGALKEQRKDPAAIPPALKDKQAKAPQPKGLPPKPPRRAAPPGAKAKDGVTKAGLEKDLKEKAAPAAVKAVDPATQARFEKGMAAIDRLVERSKEDPEDRFEIGRHLAAIKAEHGFKSIGHRLEGDEWVIDAEMNPKGGRRGKAARRLEGEVDTYSKLQGPTGDKMTPDHEPQHALMRYLAEDLNFKGYRLFRGTDLADYTHSTGVCLNMFQSRHAQTRTYQSKGSATKAAALTRISDALAEPQNAATDKAARKAVGRVVRDELDADHDEVRDIYASSDLVPETKARVTQGLAEVKALNRAKYFGAFNQ